MHQQRIRLGHSPDPDDAFMFYGLACGAVDSGSFHFEHILRDIQTLNEWALEGKLEVTAISVHAYAHVQDKYAILSSGASMGATELARYEPPDGAAAPVNAAPHPSPTGVHGPLLVAPQPLSLDNLAGKTIAVPGTMTSAFLVLQLALGKSDYQVIPFDQILEAVRRGRADAGLIIHEGQLTYRQFDLHCLLDLGRWWYEQTSLPMPLGCNAIRRDLGQENMTRVSEILKASIDYGLHHRDRAVEHALQYGRGLDVSAADQFVGMYVNEWTLDFGPAGRQAVATLLKKAAEAGLAPPVQTLQFV